VLERNPASKHLLRKRTFVPPHPNLNAASLATNSPNPNINPLINGNSKLIAAPLTSPQSVGGEYKISGEEFGDEVDDRGDGEEGDKSWL